MYGGNGSWGRHDTLLRARYHLQGLCEPTLIYHGKTDLVTTVS